MSPQAQQIFELAAQCLQMKVQPQTIFIPVPTDDPDKDGETYEKKGFYYKYHYEPSGLCPRCGENCLHKASENGPIYRQYKSIDQLEYGRYECLNGHTFKVEPESYYRGEPIGKQIK
jgi:hypothetical protein